MSQCQSAKISQSLRSENDLKPTPHDLENIFDTDEEIDSGDTVMSALHLFRTVYFLSGCTRVFKFTLVCTITPPSYLFVTL